jgi:hypothetical protein
MLSSGSGDQLCSPPAVLLWSWVFAVLFYWRLVALPCPLSLRQGQLSINQPPAVTVLWWFAVCFPILQSHLTLGVAHWLRRWAFGPLPVLFQAVVYLLPAIGLPAFPVIVYWKFTWRLASCPSPLLLCPLEFPLPLLCVSFQFLAYCSVFFFFFFFGGGECLQGAMLVYPRDVWGNTAWCLMLTCLVCWMSPKQVWSQWWQWQRQPTCFPSVTWCGEAFFRLGVQSIEVLILFGALFPPSVAPVSQQDFWFMELTLSASVL